MGGRRKVEGSSGWPKIQTGKDGGSGYNGVRHQKMGRAWGENRKKENCNKIIKNLC